MKFLPNADTIWETVIVEDYNWWGQKKVLWWTGQCRARGENVDSMEIAFRSRHNLLVYDRRQVSLSFPLHRWRNLKNKGWRTSQCSARLEPQAHSTSFVFLATVHIASVKRQELPALGLLKPDLALSSSQIRTILLHHFGCICISWRLKSEFWGRVTFSAAESFQQAD